MTIVLSRGRLRGLVTDRQPGGLPQTSGPGTSNPARGASGVPPASIAALAQVRRNEVLLRAIRMWRKRNERTRT